MKRLLGRLRSGPVQSRRDGGALAEYSRVLQCWQEGDIQKTLDLAQAARRRWPRSAELHYMVGACHFKAGRYKEALPEFAFAERLARTFPLLLLAELYAALSESRAAGTLSDLPAVAVPEDAPLASIVICSRDEGKFRKAANHYQGLFDGLPHEIVHIGDARSLAEGYNRAVDRSRGEVLIFSHDDVQIASRDFAARIHAHLQNYDLLGIAGTSFLSGGAWIASGWPHLAGQVGKFAADPGVIVVTVFGTGLPLVGGMQAVDGVLMAMRRPLAESLRFDHQTFDGWHLYDIDFSFRASLAGARLAVVNDLLVVHDSQGHFSDAWKTYEQRFIRKFEGELTALGIERNPQQCTVTVRSAEEWRSLTALRFERNARRPKAAKNSPAA
jgi:tetratricopeptide (TPR) repeat protein